MHTCLTHFPKVRDTFGDIWSNWKRKREEFGPGFYLYLGTRRGMSLYPEHRFVNLIWGVEAFHRTKYPTDPSSMAARIDNIVAQISDETDKNLFVGSLSLRTSRRWQGEYSKSLVPSPSNWRSNDCEHLPKRAPRHGTTFRTMGRTVVRGRTRTLSWGWRRRARPYRRCVTVCFCMKLAFPKRY